MLLKEAYRKGFEQAVAENMEKVAIPVGGILKGLGLAAGLGGAAYGASKLFGKKPVVPGIKRTDQAIQAAQPKNYGFTQTRSGQWVKPQVPAPR